MSPVNRNRDLSSRLPDLVYGDVGSLHFGEQALVSGRIRQLGRLSRLKSETGLHTSEAARDY